MIHFSLRLTNPFRSSDFRNLWSKNWSLSQNWNLEIETYFHARCLLSLEFDTTLSGDHPGASVEFGVYGYCLCVRFYDRRHHSDILDFKL